MGFPRLATLPTALVALVGAALAIGLPVGGYYAYQAYDYVEHDNAFCMSCHLMSGPYEAFARSEHRGLGCKACHQPTLVGRSRMALTQVVQQPDALETHADVPDELCRGCHVEGDPEEWRLIARSAGHLVHLESDDPTLEGITCVACHSTSIHAFSATDETCGQSDCHTDTDVNLGAMGDFTIHCVACHAFRAPLDDAAAVPEAAEAMRPDEDECLSCHVMRTLVDLPSDEPHGGVCATCHNPHAQTEAAEAESTCASAGCHDVRDDLGDAHRGLAPDAVNACLSCHTAHDFALDASDCQSCHDAPPPASDPHDVHPSVACLGCHAEDQSHGRLTAVTAEDCLGCHHDAAGADSCLQCHADRRGVPVGASAIRTDVRVTLDATRERILPFDHADHEESACATCHTGPPPMLDAAPLDCRQCHEDHHAPATDCTSCHVQPPTEVHPPAQVHLSCGGAGCHSDAPGMTTELATPPRTRSVCLACHQDLTDHRPGAVCVECHALPEIGG